MAALTVEAPNDPQTYANLVELPSGLVLVQLCRRTTWERDPATGQGHPVPRLLGSCQLDMPLHHAADRVHDLMVEIFR